MATPGLPPAWCYGSGGQAEVSVATDGGSISIYVVEKDIDVTVESTNDLAAWLKAYKPEAFRDPKDGFGDKLKRGRILDWE